MQFHFVNKILLELNASIVLQLWLIEWGIRFLIARGGAAAMYEPVSQLNRLAIAVIASSVIDAVTLSSRASAHVKWFASYDVAATPRALLDVSSSAFWLLVGCSLIGGWTLCKLEQTTLGAALLRSMDSISIALRSRTEELLRAATAAFFIAIGTVGTFILTPELKTDSAAISWLQFAIALGMFWRATLIFSAVGIVTLFGVGIVSYGAFHMMDYPIFLGVAGYLALTGLRREFFGLRPLDVARWATVITLMWASVEKWAYPEWTFPLLELHPTLTLGLDPSFYMTLAGIAEFGLAFTLLWTPLVRRLGALMLLAMFISAVLEFGKLDAIGHLLIVAILVATAIDDEPRVARPPLLAPAFYSGAMLAILAAYYGAHSWIFGAATG